MWFSVFCGGFQPVVDVAKSASSLGASASDPAKGKTFIVDFYSKLGVAFTGTARKLKALPPPTFSGGDAFATKVTAALEKAGPEFSKNAAKLKAIPVTDSAALSKALSGVSGGMQSALGPLQDLNSLKMTPQTQKAVEALPACAKLKTSATG